ncbi:hypothetical protein TGAMA5MH_01823 [Trichoderma gamsii]|uniref:Uncharacterized protein n=1 Tax=Trichoderma gamsii TaxID=398673 RepID=A0A2K0TMW9_9HYPO|nr:hypothetical protein TGAMA5MH_01823 [Trichoderma gamsii]
MVPKLRSKPNTRARVQRAPTKFSELDVTPSRPGEELHPSPKNDKENLPPSRANADDCFPDDRNTGDSFLDDTQDITNTATFAWSDGGSTNVTRRSTPAPPDDCPSEELWDFDDADDEAFAQLLSQDPKNTNLPDTVPLKEPSLTPGPHIDFSETASTVRRSSPFLTSDARKDIWDFSDSQSGSDSPSNALEPTDPTEELSLAPNPRSQHIAMDDIYDVTPKKATAPAQAKVAAESKAKKSKSVSANQDHSTTTVTHSKLETLSQPFSRVSAKNKRPQQKAKEPIQFDPLTQEIVDVPASRKKNPPPKRSIVSAMQESAKALSSPFIDTKKAPRRQASKRKQPKVTLVKKNKPEAEVVQLGSPTVDVLESSPMQIAQADSAEVSPDLRPVHHESKAMEKQPIFTEDISDSKQKQKRYLQQMSLAINEASDELEPLPIERAQPKRRYVCTDDVSHSRQKQTEHPHQMSLTINNLSDDEIEQSPIKCVQPKRRKLSRQISISEKGSPVVTRVAAPTRKAGPTMTEPHPFIMENTRPAVVVQRPSFLRTDSGDRLYGQQSDDTLGSSEQNLPSRWLHGLDEQQPRPKHTSSTEKHIHDDIRKSFLQSAEPPRGLQDIRPDEIVGQSQVHRQISLTVKQLMLHLESKKSAASNIVEAYHTGGIASVAYMQQQCLYDSRRVVTAIRRHGALFDKNLQAVKDAIKMRKQARIGMAGSLNELLKSQSQTYHGARLSLGAAV